MSIRKAADADSPLFPSLPKAGRRPKSLTRVSLIPSFKLLAAPNDAKLTNIENGSY
ncbi:hypothetical protein BURKHO8Y_160082 [Burkholderia sp. 8Y]|nr:hypothetical protein BURKHO8Y_160082 [Burkholderia sp. 8Y]